MWAASWLPEQSSISLSIALTMPGTRCAGLALAGARMPLRTPVVLLFLAAAPTMAVAGLRRGLDAFARIFAACAAAIIINVMVAERMLAAGAWSPDGGLVVVVVITALIEAVQLPPDGTRTVVAPERTKSIT